MTNSNYINLVKTPIIQGHEYGRLESGSYGTKTINGNIVENVANATLGTYSYAQDNKHLRVLSSSAYSSFMCVCEGIFAGVNLEVFGGGRTPEEILTDNLADYMLGDYVLAGDTKIRFAGFNMVSNNTETEIILVPEEPIEKPSELKSACERGISDINILGYPVWETRKAKMANDKQIPLFRYGWRPSEPCLIATKTRGGRVCFNAKGEMCDSAKLTANETSDMQELKAFVLTVDNETQRHIFPAEMTKNPDKERLQPAPQNIEEMIKLAIEQENDTTKAEDANEKCKSSKLDTRSGE